MNGAVIPTVLDSGLQILECISKVTKKIPYRSSRAARVCLFPANFERLCQVGFGPLKIPAAETDCPADLVRAGSTGIKLDSLRCYLMGPIYTPGTIEAEGERNEIVSPF